MTVSRTQFCSPDAATTHTHCCLHFCPAKLRKGALYKPETFRLISRLESATRVLSSVNSVCVVADVAYLQAYACTPTRAKTATRGLARISFISAYVGQAQPCSTPIAPLLQYLLCVTISTKKIKITKLLCMIDRCLGCMLGVIGDFESL